MRSNRSNTLLYYFVRLVICALTGLALIAPASAIPISYKLTGVASGSIGVEAFTDTPFTLTGNADSNGIFPIDTGITANPLGSASINLLGMSTSEVVNAFYIFVNQNIPGAGFIDILNGDTFDFEAPDFASFDGVSPLGPLSVVLTFLAPFETTNGILSISDASSVVFAVTQLSDTAIPEPSTFTLLAVGGLVGYLLRVRSRRTRLW